MESSAARQPRWRMTTREHTRSTVSSSCELDRVVLPREASSQISWRKTTLVATSRPEKGSLSSSRSGLCNKAAVQGDGDVAIVKR